MPQIPLVNSNLFAVIDDADLSLVAQHRWYPLCVKGRLYARARINGRTVLMHRLIVNALPGIQIDHVNGNGLDNRRRNLRIALPTLNQANRSKTRANRAGYKGVWHESGRWRAGLKAFGKRFYLGYFDTPEEAARAYDAKARELFGEFAKVNFP